MTSSQHSSRHQDRQQDRQGHQHRQQHQDPDRPLPHAHRANHHRLPGKRRIFRLGLLATAALGTVGTAAGAAQALAIGDGYASDTNGFAVAHTTSFALSNPHDRIAFRDSFTIHQFGDVTAAHVRNEATAESVACSANAPCRAVSLSFQIVTMAGSDIRLDAVNLGNATNQHCAGCQTVAGAYQFVVDTPRAFTLSAAAKAQLAAIHRELDALSSAKLSVADVQSKADALAGQVAAILKNAAAAAPAQGQGGQSGQGGQGGPVMHPLTSSGFSPTVKVFRDFQQH